MQNSKCKVQNGKCKHCITDSHSKLRPNDDRAEDSRDLISLTAEIMNVGRGHQFEYHEDSQPI